MRRRVEVLEHAVRVEADVRLAVVPDDLDFAGGRAHQLHSVAEFDRVALRCRSGRPRSRSPRCGSRCSRRRCRHERRRVARGPTLSPPASLRRAVFASPAKRYRLSGTFSGQRATTTTMKTRLGLLTELARWPLPVRQVMRHDSRGWVRWTNTCGRSSTPHARGRRCCRSRVGPAELSQRSGGCATCSVHLVRRTTSSRTPT